MYGLEDEDLQPQTALEDAEIDESDAWCGFCCSMVVKDGECCDLAAYVVRVMPQAGE